MNSLLAHIRFDDNGLIPVIAQDHKTKRVLMCAFMNKEAILQSLQTGEAVYWSRSKKRLWRKGETSGHTQKIMEVYLDCDGDCLLLLIEQKGVACHTGRMSCFYRQKQNDTWQEME